MNDTDTGIVLSEAAAARVRHFLSTRGGMGMRLGVKRTGCSGLAYVVDLAEEVSDADSVYESNGVRIVVDERSLPYVAGTRIDFVQDGLNATFHYDNPNVKSLCGCGESFGV